MDLSSDIKRIWVCQIFKKNNSLSWLSISILRKGSFAPTPISSNKLGFKYEVPWLCSQTKRLLDLFSVAFLSWHINLIKSVLEANLVYWFSLSYIAVGILEKSKRNVSIFYGKIIKERTQYLCYNGIDWLNQSCLEWTLQNTH